MQDQENAIVLALSFIERVVVLGTGVILVAALLYVAGSFQEFGEQTQLRLLEFVRALAPVVTVGSLLATVLEAAAVPIATRRVRLRRMVGMALAAAIGASLTTGSAALLAFVAGV